MCVCVAKPVAVELRRHATALILVIGKAQFRRAMLSCDSSCVFIVIQLSFLPFRICKQNYDLHPLKVFQQYAGVIINENYEL